jgi:hypothetical protein
MFKRIFFRSMLAGLLSATAGIIYDRIYFFATQADYTKVLNITGIISLNLLICLLVGMIYLGLITWLPKKGEIIFNFLFSIISFASVMIPISVSLPLDVQFPELFPGLAVPMLFFPVIAWHTINPFFNKSGT